MAKSAAEQYNFSHLITPKERPDFIQRTLRNADRETAHLDHLRKEIDTRECLYDVMAIRRTLIRGYEPSLENPDVFVPLDSSRTSQLRVALQAADLTLKKVLPDLRQVEILGDRDGDGHFVFQVNTGILRSADGQPDVVYDEVLPWD